MRLKTMVTLFLISMFAGAALGQDVLSKVSLDYSLTPQPHVTVTNNHSVRLTDIVIRITSTDPPYRQREVIWLDNGPAPHRQSHDYSLEPGGSRSYFVGPVNLASTLEPKLMAVEFEDGSSAGDPEWLPKLHARRQAAYDEIKSVTQLLKQALAQGQTNEQIIAALKDREASVRTSVEFSSRSAALHVIGTAEGNLELGGKVGDPQEIPAVIFPILDEWRSALTRYDKNIVDTSGSD